MFVSGFCTTSGAAGAAAAAIAGASALPPGPGAGAVASPSHMSARAAAFQLKQALEAFEVISLPHASGKIAAHAVAAIRCGYQWCCICLCMPRARQCHAAERAPG